MGSQGVFVFIKSVADVTLVWVTLLMHCHHMSRPRARSRKQLETHLTLQILLSVCKNSTCGKVELKIKMFVGDSNIAS